MIEEYLINYGVLGVWTLSLLYERFHFQKRILAVISENTKALNMIRNKIKKSG